MLSQLVFPAALLYFLHLLIALHTCSPTSIVDDIVEVYWTPDKLLSASSRSSGYHIPLTSIAFLFLSWHHIISDLEVLFLALLMFYYLYPGDRSHHLELFSLPLHIHDPYVLVTRILVHAPWNAQLFLAPLLLTLELFQFNRLLEISLDLYPFILPRSGWSCCENQPLATHGIFWIAFIIVWHSYAVYDFVETLTLSETMLVSYSMIGRLCVHCVSIALIDFDLLTFRFHHPPRTGT